jgi:hypothetical protein
MELKIHKYVYPQMDEKELVKIMDEILDTAKQFGEICPEAFQFDENDQAVITRGYFEDSVTEAIIINGCDDIDENLKRTFMDYIQDGVIICEEENVNQREILILFSSNDYDGEKTKIVMTDSKGLNRCEVNVLVPIESF